MHLIGLLDDRADKAGEVGQVARQHGLAELDIGNAGGSAGPRPHGMARWRTGRTSSHPNARPRQRQIFLALELMKKLPLVSPASAQTSSIRVAVYPLARTTLSVASRSFVLDSCLCCIIVSVCGYLPIPTTWYGCQASRASNFVRTRCRHAEALSWETRVLLKGKGIDEAAHGQGCLGYGAGSGIGEAGRSRSPRKARA